MRSTVKHKGLKSKQVYTKVKSHEVFQFSLDPDIPDVSACLGML